MITDTHRMIDTLFHIYRIRAWGSVYSTNQNILQKLQNKLIKIVKKNQFITDKNPLSLNQLFAFEAYILSTID